MFEAHFRTYLMPLRLLLAAAVAIILMLPHDFLSAQEDAGPSPWLARFEQSYGTEGLYVVEIRPDDPAGPSRLNIQLLNAAAARFRTEHPDRPISLSGLEMRGMLPDLHEAPEDEEYVWDGDLGMFTSSLGGTHTPEAGILLLLEGYERIRQRILEPDNFVRSRWQRLYEDEDAPEWLRREILLREFLLEHYRFPLARRAEAIQQELRRLDAGIEAYALMQGLSDEDEVALEAIVQGGFYLPSRPFPPGMEIELERVGEGAWIELEGYTITGSPESVSRIRLDRAAEVFQQSPNFPPALALAARFQEPERSVAMLDRAIQSWPEVPGLRVERMSHHARMREFGQWQEDLDFILQQFPAAPLLVEIEIAAEQGRVSRVPEFQAQLATILADVRPDLLAHQLYAYTVLQEVGEDEVAQTVWERLVFANPAWRLVLPPPDGEEEDISEIPLPEEPEIPDFPELPPPDVDDTPEFPDLPDLPQP